MPARAGIAGEKRKEKVTHEPIHPATLYYSSSTAVVQHSTQQKKNIYQHRMNPQCVHDNVYSATAVEQYRRKYAERCQYGAGVADKNKYPPKITGSPYKKASTLSKKQQGHHP